MTSLSRCALVAALAAIAGPAAAQGTGAALTHPGTLATGTDLQLGLVVPSATERRAAFTAADAVLAVLRRDDALAHPIGYSVGLRRVAGISSVMNGGQPIANSLHYGVTGTLAYLVAGDDGGVTPEGEKEAFSVVVNAPGRLTDAEELASEPDRGPSVLDNVRQTGTFRGHPVYNGECVVLSGRPAPPFVPLTKERYQRILIAGTRADSIRHAQDRRDDAVRLAAAGARPKSAKDSPDSVVEAAYKAMKAFDPAGAEKYRQQMLQAAREADSMVKAQANDPAARRGDSLVKAMTAQAPAFEGQRLRELQAALDAMSPAERQSPVAVIIHGVGWDFHSDGLADINDPDSSPLVQLNPAFFDRTRPATTPQIITVCLPGLQGLVDKRYEMYAGDEREQERAKAERRAHDAALIRDRLDWAALEALVKP